MNPRSYRKKVATDTISGFGRKHKFHFTPIPETWFKVDVQAWLSSGQTRTDKRTDEDEDDDDGCWVVRDLGAL
jgi:hypothetical protein